MYAKLDLTRDPATVLLYDTLPLGVLDLSTTTAQQSEDGGTRCT